MREAITTNPQKRVAILVLPSFSNLTLAAVMEPLRAVNRQAGRTLFTWSLLTEEGRPIASSSGLRISPDRSIAEAEPFDWLLVVASFDAESGASPKIRQFLRRAARQGALIAGMESAAYVLALAGVLDGHRATTHWEDLQDFTERFPAIEVVPNRFVIDRRRVTSGGYLPSLDLMLEMLRREFGLGLSLAVSSAFIYRARDTGDEPQPMVATGRLGALDAAAQAAIHEMETNIAAPLSIAAIADRIGFSPRELQRRFVASLGTSPKKYYLELQLVLARRLLEHADMPVVEIAAGCGFASGSAFARAFRARFGINPSDFRQRSLEQHRKPSKRR